ncbi:MAG: YetF domain-containing protein [Bacillota bacterium]
MLLKTIWTTLVVYLTLFILTRIIGRKLLSQITFFDFIISITIGTISANYIINQVRGYWILISLFLLTIYVLSSSYLTMKSLRLRKIIEGEPIIMIQNGKILEDNLARAHYNLDNLNMQLRQKGIFDLTEVEFAILESHGKLSVLKKSSNQPVTPNDLNLSTTYEGLPSEIIKDGEVLEQNLSQNQLDFNWLYQELKRHQIDDISEVVLATLNTDGTLYIDQRNITPDYSQPPED